MSQYFLDSTNNELEVFHSGGGKAGNLWRMGSHGINVPAWLVVTASAQKQFIKENGFYSEFHSNSVSPEIMRTLFSQGHFTENFISQLEEVLQKRNLLNEYLAVRSSGLDEDSAEHSFAGQFSSYLYIKGLAEILESIKQCWASAYSERAIRYRQEKKIKTHELFMGVVIQKMVQAEVSGIAFSRNPIHPLDRENLVISSAWGLCEGIVSGELDADHITVDRENFKFKIETSTKKFQFVHDFTENKLGITKKELNTELQNVPSLTEVQIRQVSSTVLNIESKLGGIPQDCEWAFERDILYFVQTRPITTLPPNAFFDESVHGAEPTLWDNSNIIESYSGVTSPLTFTFASFAYRQVYIQFCEVMGIPPQIITSYEPVFRNMLGSIRGRIYYNLINWYRLVLLLPGSSNNQGFMDTMMGVRKKLSSEHQKVFEILKDVPRFNFFQKLSLYRSTLTRFIKFDSIMNKFYADFNEVYNVMKVTNFHSKPLPELGRIYQSLETKILKNWKAPIINDYLCMLFFGLLKKLTLKWLAPQISRIVNAESLQNDLLCGQGDLESTEPTKMLMKIAEEIDLGDRAWREYFINTSPNVLVQDKKVMVLFEKFLDRFGFRCVNELKLEEPDLHDDPSFAVAAVIGYVKMKSYSIHAMEEREKSIRGSAEKLVAQNLKGWKKGVYFWILKQTRRSVRNRENLRFLRTKIFGIARRLFKAIGFKMHQLGALETPSDVFYLTIDEVLAFIEGRQVLKNPRAIATMRRHEFDEFRKTPSPPDRFLTVGAVGAYMPYAQVLADADLLKTEIPVNQDPSYIYGTSCCPGVVEGVVKVVETIEEAKGIAGEILVTERTDPGWVPLYPSCSGLLIERGSLLSHSAVVARELGLPTIVGAPGLMKKLKTGMRVRVDAAKGEIKIL